MSLRRKSKGKIRESKKKVQKIMRLKMMADKWDSNNKMRKQILVKIFQPK